MTRRAIQLRGIRRRCIDTNSRASALDIQEGDAAPARARRAPRFRLLADVLHAASLPPRIVSEVCRADQAAALLANAALLVNYPAT